MMLVDDEPDSEPCATCAGIGSRAARDNDDGTCETCGGAGQMMFERPSWLLTLAHNAAIAGALTRSGLRVGAFFRRSAISPGVFREKTAIQLARISLLEADDGEWDPSEQECIVCHSMVHTPPDLDPTPMCDRCAQGALVLVAAEAVRLTTASERGRRERDSIRDELDEVARDAKHHRALAKQMGSIVDAAVAWAECPDDDEIHHLNMLFDAVDAQRIARSKT